MAKIAVGEAARLLGVSAQTVRRYIDDGRLPSTRTPAGHRRLDRDDIRRLAGELPAMAAEGRIEAHYIRVSGADDASLETQKSLLEASSAGVIYKMYSDRASGLNQHRPGLERLLRDARAGKFSVVRVTHADRLARFCGDWLKQLLEAYGVALEVMDPDETKSPREELLSDFMSLVASFSGRLYRLRGHANQRRLLEAANDDIDGRTADADG